MKQNTKQTVLQSAARLFYKKGFSATTTAEIANQAGVAEVTLFRHFKTKKDILLSITEQFIDTLGQEFVTNPIGEIIKSGKDSSVMVIIRTILKERIELLEKNYDVIWIVLTEVQHHPELKDRFVAKHGRTAVEMLEGLFQYGIDRGELRDINPHGMLRALFGAVMTIIAMHRILPDLLRSNTNLEEMVNEQIDIFLNGISN